MSDDLISRRALLEAIDSSFVTPILKINMREEHKAVSKIWEIIVNMPTAFDKEKVIEELQRADPIIRTFVGKSFTTIERAIEIVEKGGIE